MDFKLSMYMFLPQYLGSHSLHHCFLIQERIRVGKELLEAKRIEEDNERKRSDSPVFSHPMF